MMAVDSPAVIRRVVFPSGDRRLGLIAEMAMDKASDAINTKALKVTQLSFGTSTVLDV